MKAGGYRDIPIHTQLVNRGFWTFEKGSADGALFTRSRSSDPAKQRRSTLRLGNRLSGWLQSLAFVPDGVVPNYAFRHCFKTVGRECEFDDAMLDAICGHAGKTAGNGYGSATLATRQRAIGKFPWWPMVHFRGQT